MQYEQKSILDVTIDAVTKYEALKAISELLDSNGQSRRSDSTSEVGIPTEASGSQIATINAEFVMAAQQDERFRNILNNSALRLADGIGLLWASKYLAIKSQDKRWAPWQLVYSGASLIFWPSYCRSEIPARISGADLMVDISALAEKSEQRVFLLGAKPGVAAAAAQSLQKKFPNLKIDWKLNIENWKLGVNQADDQAVIESVNEAQSHILFVAVGHPRAQLWIDDSLKLMPSVKIAMGVGGSFDFIAGKVKRAPKIMRNLGLEWLWRLGRQPQRLPRIMTATVKFIYKVCKFNSN